MKNSTKLVLMIGLFLIIMGCLFTGLGLLMGGSPSFNISNRGINVKKSEMVYKLDKTKVGTFKSIDMDLSYADIIFKEADDYYIEYYFTGSIEPSYQVANDKLIFRDKKKANTFQINFLFFEGASQKDEVVIYLPKDAQVDNADVKLSSGDIKMGGLQAKDLYVKSSFGDVTLYEVESKAMDIKLSAGELKINDVEAGKLTISNSYGDISMDSINTKKVYDGSICEIGLSSGSLTIKNMSADIISLDNSYGDIEMDQVTAGELKTKLSSGEFKVTYGDFNKVTIDNKFGDANVELIGQESDYQLNLSTKFGEVSVMDREMGSNYDNNNAGVNHVVVDASSGDVNIKFTNP